MTRPAEAKAGFTLMEVMIASVIMAFVLVSTIAVISRSAKYVADLRLYTRSSQILQQRVEELRVMNWSNITVCATTFTNVADPQQRFAGAVNMSPYWSIGSTAIVMRASVTVTWTNRQSRVITNRLATLISDAGLNKVAL